MVLIKKLWKWKILPLQLGPSCPQADHNFSAISSKLETIQKEFNFSGATVSRPSPKAQIWKNSTRIVLPLESEFK